MRRERSDALPGTCWLAKKTPGGEFLVKLITNNLDMLSSHFLVNEGCAFRRSMYFQADAAPLNSPVRGLQ